ncbi:MAG: SDR family NAD(P)-dependent oxidoreductase [Candidatus Promineifilaceae bacterium]
MQSSEERAIAIVGVGAILPDALSAPAFWDNILNKKYSITEVPPERWSIEDYYDPDPGVPDKTYSKIGGWVRGFEYDWRRFRMPPKVAAAMDQGQQWAVTIAAEALEDYGYPERPLDTDNTAVILGTVMGGELHYITHQRIAFPEFANALSGVDEFNRLPKEKRDAILSQWRERIGETFPQITEDSMPGELPNIVSGRVANLFNLRGPNFITDAACASSFAALKSAVELLNEHDVDAVLTGGVDHNMGISSFVKFCKIGALSASGSRPFGDGADGFVMGEGSGAFLLKRLEDAERSGDKIYAVIRGIGGSSDGKGKGITAPNPIGQELAVRRAWQNAGLDPATATLVEAHGTSTRVGDVVEVESLAKIFGGAAANTIGLGSVKSNIGHLKAGAGAAGLLKAAMALHHKILPPTLNAERPNPNIDFARTPFRILYEAEVWPRQNGTPRRCGVSAYGFGGTNFHVVLEEHVPGYLTAKKTSVPVAKPAKQETQTTKSPPKPVRGILAIGANSLTDLQEKLDAVTARVEGGWTPPRELPRAADIQAPERLVIDFGDHQELAERIAKARKVMSFDNPQAWEAMEAQGIFRGSGGAPGKIAFMFPGQGSQYVNMGRELSALSAVVAGVFAEADKVMEPILDKPLTEYIFVDAEDSGAMMQAQFDLLQTEITQPAMLAMDTAMMKLLAEYGFEPDMVVGHSLGEYAALIAAEALPFADALEAVAARGSEMSKVSWDDNGRMAAVLAPFDVVMEMLEKADGYVVPANINSYSQCVIGGASEAVERVSAAFEEQGYRAIQIPVSHAFHTEIVAPASEPLRQVLDRLSFREAKLPIVANVTGQFYPQTVEEIKDMLQVQVASPVQWVKGLETLYDAGVRTFVEVGPKRALRGFARDVLKGKENMRALLTNHPKTGELAAFNQALCGLYAAGYLGNLPVESVSEPVPANRDRHDNGTPAGEIRAAAETFPSMEILSKMINEAVWDAVGRAAISSSPAQAVYDRNRPPLGSVVISGTGLGLPGAEKDVMDPDNAMRILRGEQFVDLIPERFRNRMVKKRITRVVKAEDGSGSLQTINDPADVIKLAGRPGRFDLEAEYGVSRKLIEALDITSQVAIAAGLDALREAGIPLVQTYRETTTGKSLPDRWLLPESLRDETGVIFASAFPGGDRFAQEFRRYYEWQNRVDQLAALEDLRRYSSDGVMLDEINRRISMLRTEMEADPYTFDRRFLFRILSMGHSQFAQYIGARGPNTQLNAACASTAQSIALAEDWIRSGRCRRVIVIGGDVVTSDELMDWVGAGFLAVGAATTKDRVDEAALPFDARRHGTIMGMGACGLVVESEDALRERGMRGIVEVLSSETSNSAFHGTRLDIDHISMVMEHLVSSAERRFALNRYGMAPNMVFMSHETYTPARGGSAAAEIMALRRTFGQSAGDIIIANTKGFTGHPMGVGIEDVIAVKILEQGIVPPVPNIKEADPDLGVLNLSRGGRYPVQYALHLAAGFGSQISMTLTRRIPGGLERIDNRGHYKRWLAGISGDANAQTEVEKRVLRIVDRGKPENMPAASTWQYGTGPTQRAVEAAASSTPPSTRRVFTTEIRPAPEQLGIKPAIPETAETALPVFEKTEEPAAAPEEPAAAKRDSENADPLVERIIGLVAEQTGYPPDMLDLDLDLEADLGIDTVKQAETFLAIREMFDIPQQEALSLRDYNTLEKVIGFVKEMRPDLAALDEPAAVEVEAPSAAAAMVVPDEPQPGSTGDPVADLVLALVAEQTGYPVDMLEHDLDLEADLGIDTVKQAETFLAIREMFDIPQQQELSLRDYNTLEKVIGFVKEMRPDLGAASSPAPANASAGESMPAAEPNIATTEPAMGDDVIASQVLALVAEQTGYPEDMLEMDLDLEADLGIDTVKQAETFLAIREMFDIPQQQELSLRDYNTLEKVIGFVKEMRPDLAQTAVAPLTAQTAEVAGVKPQEAKNNLEPITYNLADADLLPRRVPKPSLRPDLDLCKETGVMLGDAGRIVIMPDEGGVAESLVSRLHKLGAEPLLLNPAASTNEMIQEIESWLEQGAIQGVYWLPALDVEPDLEVMTLDKWHDHNKLRVKKFYVTMRALYDSISTPGKFLLTATRLGGLHGYGAEGASAPLGGGVTGFAKAFHIEQRLRGEGRGPLVKCVDFAPSRKTAALADILISETVADPGVVEVGIYEDRRYGITLQEESAVDGQPGVTLNADTVFLVTGAAGGITNEIVADLAFNNSGTFYLLDLAEAPDANDPDVQLFRSDKEGLKQQLIERARANGERPTPVAIEKKMAQIERSEAALKSIESVEAAGGTAHYLALDLLDAAAVTAVVDEIRERHGRIDVLIHGAGLLIDRTLPDKEPQQFDLVYDVKADGYFNILKAAQDMPLGASIVFSSVAGRFGNNGQSDYSAANDLLCKITSSMRRRRPETKAIAIDWTAWGDIGMAARGSVPTVMKALGIDMLPPASGVPTVRRELTAGGFSGEVLVAGELGVMVNEIDATGGLDVTKANQWLAEKNGDLLMAGQITGAPLYGGLQIETTLDPAVQPFLFDHVPDEETPWLPGVMAIEGLAEAAALLAPGFHVDSVRHVEMSGAFKFFHSEPRTLYLNVFAEPGQDGTLAARVTLHSITAPAREGLPMRTQVHFRAGVLLASQISAMPDVEFTPPENAEMPTTAEQIYKIFFHGPAYQVIERAGVSGSRAVSRMADQLPTDREPAGARMLMAPRLVELCFQSAAQWSVETKEAMAFPIGVESLSVYLQENDTGAARLFALVNTEDDGETFDARVVDENGRVYVDLRGYRTVSRPGLQ